MASLSTWDDNPLDQSHLSGHDSTSLGWRLSGIVSPKGEDSGASENAERHPARDRPGIGHPD